MLKEAIIYYIEKGDIRTASRLSGLSLDEFRDLLRRANVPVVVRALPDLVTFDVLRSGLAIELYLPEP